MPIQDDAVNDYLRALESAEDEFLKDVKQMEEDGFSTAEILAFLAALNMSTYFIEDLRMAAGVSTAVLTTTNLLDDMQFFGSITETQLVALSNVQQSTLLKYANYTGETIRQEIMNGIQAGYTESQIKDSFTRSSLVNKARIDDIVADTVTNYEQQVIFTMAEDLPGNTEFHYVGPLDSRTRPLCRDIIAAAPMTRQEIDSRFPGCLTDRGGRNCRHVWSPVSPDVSYKKEAQGQIQTLKDAGKYKKPLTLKQYYDAR